MSGFIICGNVYGARQVEHDDIHSACKAREEALLLRIMEQRALIEEQGVQIADQQAHMQQQGELAEQQKALAEQQGDQLQHQQAQIADQQAQIADQQAQIEKHESEVKEVNIVLEEMAEETTLYVELIEMLKAEINALNSLIPKG